VTLLEAYPCDKPAKAADDSMWFGAKSMFDRAGFVEVARRKPTRPVMRKRLHAARRVAVAPASVDGRSLVPLLHGQKVDDWRTVALVEHRGPHDDPTDPDAPAVRSGNPTTYEAIRAQTSVYVEYADGEKEYHDLTADPHELRNSFSSLSAARKSSLHETLEAVKDCHDAKSCTKAERK